MLGFTNKDRIAEEDAEFVTDASLGQLIKTPRSGKLLLWLILLFIVAMVYWSLRFTINESVRGMGTARPAGKHQVVQSVEGGRIYDIYVKEGQKVKKGDLLLELDYTEAKSELDALKAEKKALEAQYKIARQRLALNEPLLKKGAISRTEILSMKENVAGYRARIDKIEEEIPRLEFRKEQTSLYSPADGIVQKILVNSVGAAAKPGETLVEIVPVDEEVVFEVKLTPKDIGFVKPGQRAVIRVSAYDYAIYGSLEGEIREISPDVFIDEKGNSYFIVIVHLKPDQAHSKFEHLKIIPGMSATVDINIAERTVLEFVLKPLIKILQPH